jgi:hypothetical protein
VADQKHSHFECHHVNLSSAISVPPRQCGTSILGSATATTVTDRTFGEGHDAQRLKIRVG